MYDKDTGDWRTAHVVPYGPSSMEHTRTALGAGERVMGAFLLGFSIVQLLRDVSKHARASR